MKLYRFDSTTGTLDYNYEQQRWFGRSAAVLYRDQGLGVSNLFVGGSSDPIHINDGDGKEWSPAIALIDDSG